MTGSSQRIGLDDYLKLLAKTITQVHKGSGRHKQSVAESSFEAWTKYYRQDENSPNAIVSYYTKGALVALCLDLALRRESAHSLDDVMRALWQRWLADGQGVSETGWEALAMEVSGLDLRDFFQRALRSTDALPLTELLASVGVTLKHTVRDADDASRPTPPTLGVKTERDPLGWRIKCAYQDGPAQQAGLSGGDVLLALDGLRTYLLFPI